MALTPCEPCDCKPGNIANDKFKQDVENILCATLTALGYTFDPDDACNPCKCIQANIPNDKFKQDIEVLLCLILANIGAGGGGTVTSFSFTNANGITGVVTNPATTPDLTLSLDNASVTYAILQNVGAFSLVGNATGAPASATDIPLGDGLSFSGGTLVSSGITIGLALALQSGTTSQ